MGYGDGESFRSQDGAFRETCTTCGANPLSNRPVHHGGGFRPYRALDETTRLGNGGLLQLAGGGDFNAAGSRHWATRVAVPTRGKEAEGNSFAAPGTRVRLERDDMAGVVDTCPRPKADCISAKLPSGG